MIYSDEFVWLHFPKCAGTKIEKLFMRYYSNDERIYQDKLDRKNDTQATWHDSVALREKRDPNFLLKNRVVICSFRMLLPWLESRYSFEVRRSPHLNHRPELLLEGKFLERRGNLNHADDYAKKYIPENFMKSNNIKFIRTECFESDFKETFGRYLDISRIPGWEFKKKVNTSTSAVPAEILKKLYQNQQMVYENCPYWKAVESIAYQ